MVARFAPGVAERDPGGRSDVLVDFTCAHFQWNLESLSGACRGIDLSAQADLRDSTLRSAAILILSDWSPGDTAGPGALREIRRRHPSLAILVATTDVGRFDWHTAVRAGVDDVVLVEGAPSRRELVRVVADRLMAPAPVAALEAFAAGTGTDVAPAIVAWCLRNAVSPRPVRSIARHFGMSARSLRRLLRAAGYPAASRVWRCGRMLHAAELDRRGGLSREELARRVGYSDAAALRSARSTLRGAVAREALLRRFVTRFDDLAWAAGSE